MATQNGTDGRVYGGDCSLIHVRDYNRTSVGKDIAAAIDMAMRREALASGTRTPQQAVSQQLCPGCYMIVAFNALVYLAERNGQSRRELAQTMAEAFLKLAAAEGSYIEEIHILLDR